MQATPAQTWKTIDRRLKKAQAVAEEIVDAQGVFVPPVDPFLIAASEDPLLTLIVDDFGDAFDGQIEFHRRHNRFLVFLNSKYDTSSYSAPHHCRTRFSLAHELGHYFLDAHHAYLIKSGAPHSSISEFSTDQVVEREADSFAAALLMPTKAIRSRVNRGELSLARIQEIALLFETSLVSTAIRCVQLSDFPCSIVGIRDGVVAWQFVSQALISAGFYPAERGSIASRSCTDQWSLFRQGRASPITAETQTSDWFRTYGHDSLADIYAQEEFFPVPSMATLLVLLTVAEDDLAADEDD